MSIPKTNMALLGSLALLAGCATHPTLPRSPQVDPLHRALLTLDTHIDTAVHFGRAGWNFSARHDRASELAQLDIPRMADGNLDGGFFSIFTPQGPLTAQGYAAAAAFAFKRSAQIDSTIALHDNRISTGRNAADALRFHQQGKLIAFKSLENSYPVGDNVSLLADFYRQGVRLAGPVHTTNNQFADSSTDEPRWNGLSPLGQAWVAEMNRLGMVVDGSHASDAAFDQMLALSKTPLILSHSGSKAKFDHPRNLDDGRLRKLAASGGAICFTPIYLSKVQMGPERAALFDSLEHIETLSPQEQADVTRRWRALDATAPLWTATFEDYMTALLHTISVAGVDHVCFGADFDGGGVIAGLEDVTDLPRITARLRQAGYTEIDLGKMWSGNVLRIMRTAEEHAERSKQAVLWQRPPESPRTAERNLP